MTRKSISYISLIAIVLTSPILAGSPASQDVAVATEVEAEQTCGDLTPQELTSQETVTLLQSECFLWLDAVLSGSESEAEQLEKNLLGIISLDIMINEERVRAMAKRVALAPGASDSEELSQAITSLNTKEALYRAAVKADAFSNKYRLLGDYIDLLRRELKMPRLKLAAGDKSFRRTGGRNGSRPALSE
jgi:hypothetical protein